MASGYACQHCSRLPPPPVFNLQPPPNLFAIEIRCSSRSLSSSSMKTSKNVSSSLSIILGILIAFLIFASTFVLIKKRLVNRRKQRRRRHKSSFNDPMMLSSSSAKFNHQNWTKLVPLLSDSSSSEQTSATPPHQSLLTRDFHPHEYEQIKCDESLSGSLHYYCLIYCRQCANYHPTTSSSSSSSSLCPRTNLIRPCYLPLSSNPTCQHQCTCYHRTYHHQANDNRFFEHQPMFMTRLDHNHSNTTPTSTSDDFHPQLNFIEEIPPTF